MANGDLHYTYDQYVEQMKHRAWHGMRIELQMAEWVDNDHIKYYYRMFKTDKETMGNFSMVTFRGGKAIPVEPVNPGNPHGRSQAVRLQVRPKPAADLSLAPCYIPYAYITIEMNESLIIFYHKELSDML